MEVIALSVDDEEDARKMADEHGARFTFVYGLDGPETAETIGGYRHREKGFLHPANFILRNGEVYQATYSSGPLGRLRAEHVKKLVAHEEED